MTVEQKNTIKTDMKVTRLPKYDLDTGLDYSDLDLTGFQNVYQAMWFVRKHRHCKMEDPDHPEEGFLYRLRNKVRAQGSKVTWQICWRAAEAAYEAERSRLNGCESTTVEQHQKSHAIY